MDPKSRFNRRRGPKRRKGGASSSGSRKHSSSKGIAPSQSFAPAPTASRSTIRLLEPKHEIPVFKVFLAAFCGVILLVLLGGGHNTVALGVALLLPGLTLLFKPPVTGLGKLGDLGVAGLLLCLLLAFVPQFYWPTAEWRQVAVETFGIQLPAVLSVQPWSSFEAWLTALAGFAWLYVALQLPINLSGRRWLFFWLSILLTLLAGILIWGNTMGARYPAADAAGAFSFFPYSSLTANFLALGGIATFAYAMEGLRTRTALPLVGVPSSALCFVALISAGSVMGVLLYFLGMGLWFLCSLRARMLPRFLKFGLPAVAIVFAIVIFSNARLEQGVVRFVSSDLQFEDSFQSRIYQDIVPMVLDAPLSGVGLGSFSAVFPQYREASVSHEAVVHPESDFFWLASEGGLLAIGFLLLVFFGYSQRCRGLLEGGSGGYRVLALVAVLVFLLHALVDVPGHWSGTVYFAILFAALALPNRLRPKSVVPPLFWRATGGILTLFGVVWLFAGVFNLPVHSSARVSKYQDEIREHVTAVDFGQATQAVDEWVALRPLDWQAYFKRAELTLSKTGNLEEADADFKRARFVEPLMGVVSYEESRVWLTRAPARTIAAWRETLSREVEDMDGIYAQMLATAKEVANLLEGMARLSEINPHYRVLYLYSLEEGDRFMPEIRMDLEQDPSLSRYNVAQRTGIVRAWVGHGDLDSAEAFIAQYGDSLEHTWWLNSIILKNKADFEKAVVLIRENLEVPEVPEVPLDEVVFARLQREYAVAPMDVMKGTALMYYYLQNQQYGQAMPIFDNLMASQKPPLYIYYWRAECLYRVGEYIESWYAFEEYLKQLWE